jgi:hypothetical protein
MKHLHLYRFLLLFLFAAMLQSCNSGNLTLIENTQSDYVIYVSSDAIASEKYAARKLQQTLMQMGQYVIPITSVKPSTTKVIYVGTLGLPEGFLADIDISDFGKEEYVIRTKDDALIIAGGQPRGTLYGVLGFLSDQLGCRWYTNDVVKIPQLKNITIQATDVREKPVFEYREAWYKEAYDTEWAVHNRLNPTIVPIPDSLGGSYIMKPFVHTFYQLVSPEKYMNSHPEYFSLVDGKRLLDKHKGQLCLTNPEVVKIAIQTVFRWIKETPNAEIFSIDQNDGYLWCECDACAALDEAEGSHSGTVLNFVNQIADTVAKVYPEVKLQTLAYAYTEIPPKTIVPRENVTIRMCHYNYCNAHAIDGCDNHIPFLERMAGWEKITDRITIWDYYTDFAHYFIPYPNFDAVINNPKYYADHKSIGLFAQGNNVSEQGGGEFSALRAWVFAQLMWNPHQNGHDLIEEFVVNVYGSAAPYIQQYITLMHDQVTQDSSHFSIYDDPATMDFLTPEIVNEAELLFTEAERLASNDPELLSRVELAHLPILYAQLYFYSVGGNGFLQKEKLENTISKFEHIIDEHQIKVLAEARTKDAIGVFIDKVKSARSFVTDWWIIGPFDNTERNGFDTVYPPETSFDTTANYRAEETLQVQWKRYNNQRSGYIDFTKLFTPVDEVLAYAYRTIHVEQDTMMEIGIGSNDGIKAWVNGKLELSNKSSRKAAPNQEIIPLLLKKGDNTVLLKVDQLGGGWGFYFTLSEVQSL